MTELDKNPKKMRNNWHFIPFIKEIVLILSQTINTIINLQTDLKI